MPLKSLTAILICLFIFQADVFSQSSVSGKLKDTTSETSVQYSVISLLNAHDSTFAGFTRANADGSFSITNVPAGNYILMVTHPSFADYIEDITIGETPLNVNSIALTNKSKLLDEVIVRSGTSIRIKGDTTIYAADSFAVGPNANVEELLKKLPGIQVDKNGEIKAMGQTVQKVLVDGEEFFGEDPGMAVKNLRADAVKEVQVFDKKSEQAEFTGIDDGNTQKTINLKLKEDKKRGYFGKIDVSGGIPKDFNNRFNNNLMFSSFKGKRKISAYFLNGNTGQDGLSWQDAEKYGNSNDNLTSQIDEESGATIITQTTGGSDEEPYVNTQNGLIRNVNAGIQYSNKWNDKHVLNFSPKYNEQDYDNYTQVYTQTNIGDSMLIENNNTMTHVDRYNVKNNAIFETKIDSAKTLKLTLKANFYHTESSEERAGSGESGTGVLKNTTARNQQSIIDKQAVGANLIYRQKFKKAKRTLSFAADWNLITGESEFKLLSNNATYNNGVVANIIEQNQIRNSDNSTNRFSGRVVYTEPVINKNFALELGYSFIVSSGKNNQQTYSYSPVSGKYDVLLDSLTNDFDQLITEHRPNIKLSYNTKKLSYNFGAGVGLVNFDLEDRTIQTNYDRNYTNFFPTASLNYKYKSNSNLRFSYNGATRQPTINQMQPLRQNDDYFNQYIGNPDLKPTFNHSFNLTHQTYSFLKEYWMYQSVSLSIANNSITNSKTIILDSGKTIIKPINTDGNINLYVWTGGGFKLKKPNIRINIQPFGTFNKYAEIINDVKTYSKITSLGLGLYVSKEKSKVYDIGIHNSLRFNKNSSTAATAGVQYLSNTMGADVTVYYKKVWSISTEYDFDWREATSAYDESVRIHLWNARLQRTFAKDEFTAYITIRDILNQNIGIDRGLYSNVYRETRNERLKRYWMIGFAWNFKNKK
jgi:hypothetical protein